MCKNIASPNTRAKPSVQGTPLELLLPNVYRNIYMASGKTRGYGHNVKDWVILSDTPNPYMTWYGGRATTG